MHLKKQDKNDMKILRRRRARVLFLERPMLHISDTLVFLSQYVYLRSGRASLNKLVIRSLLIEVRLAPPSLL